MNSRARGAPWGVFAIVAILTKAASAFYQEQKGAVLVRAAVPAAYSEESLLRTKVKASFLLENATLIAQTFDVNRIGIFRIVRWGKSIFFQPERSPLLHNSCQLLTSQFELVRHPDSQAKIGLFARALRLLGNFKFPTAVARPCNSTALRAPHSGPVGSGKTSGQRSFISAGCGGSNETSKGGSKSVIGVTDL